MIGVQVTKPGVTTISQNLVPVQPMAPPSASLNFISHADSSTKDYISKNFKLTIREGNLFIVFLDDALIQGAYFKLEEAKQAAGEDLNIVPTWVNTDNRKLSKRLYIYYSDIGGSMLASRINEKISWSETFYKHRAVLVFNFDTLSYDVETCDTNPSYDFIMDLPTWTAKYGTPYH